MSRLPIRLRLTAATAVVMSVVLTGLGLFLYLRLASHLSDALDRDLRLRTQDLAALVRQSGRSLAETGSGRLVEHGESYAQLVAPDGHTVAATRPLSETPLLTLPEVRQALRQPITLQRESVPGLDEPSRLLATAVRSDGQRRVLVVGETLQDRSETLASFRAELLLAGPIALILACGLGYVLAGASLRQVESMRRQAAAISASTPAERLAVPPTGDELQRLGTTLNEMLDRLQGALERERAFVADAGHELRTPLALLRTELELALRQAGSAQELRDAVARSSAEVVRLSQLAEDLLLIARANDGKLPLRAEPLDVDDVFAAVLSRFEWRAAEEGKHLSAEAGGAQVAGDRLRIEQALGNLVDNALRYGGDEIRLEAGLGEAGVRLHVLDNGPGFPADLRDRAFERFSRGDGARSRGGAGLGLAIVRTIAQAHGGSAGAGSGNGAGADVWLSLPQPSP